MRLFSLTLFFILTIFLITTEASQTPNNESTNKNATNSKDNVCANIQGECMNSGSCKGLKIGNLCSGANTVCCMKSVFEGKDRSERGVKSNKCTSFGGICTQGKGFSDGIVIKNLCPDSNINCYFRFYNTSSNEAANNKTENNKATSNETATNKTTNNDTLNDKTVNDKTVSDKTVSDKTVNDKTVNDKTVNDKTVNDETVNDKTVNKTENSKTTSYKTVSTKIGKNKTTSYKTTNNKTTKHRTIRYKTTKRKIANHKTISYKTTNHKTTPNKTSSNKKNKCTNFGGKCMDSKSCNGIAIKGLCPGGNNSKCCLKKVIINHKSKNHKTNNHKINNLKTNHKINSHKNNNHKSNNHGTTNNKNVNKNIKNNKNDRCASIGGECMNSKNCSNGLKINGLCSSGSNNKCCLKNTNKKIGNGKITNNKIGKGKTKTIKTTSIKTTNNKITNNKSGNNKATNQKSVNEKTTNQKTVNEKATNQKSVNEKNTNQKSVNEKNTSNKATDDVITNNITRTNIISKKKYSSRSSTWKCEDHKICASALNKVGSDEWSPDVERKADNNKDVLVQKGQPKCNLFVYEMLLNNGIDIGTPNRGRKYFIIPTPRPPLAEDWFNFKDKINDENSKLRTYFKTVRSKNESRPGDIIVSKDHIGIVSNNYKNSSKGNNKERELCISASFTDKKIVNNEWGFTRGGPVKIYRLKDDYLKKVCPKCSA